MLISKQQALDYHNGARPGKIEVTPTKPCRTQRDLSLAYTPGVAEPCLEIQKNPQDAFKYTGRGNLVAVLSNGTAVLGLGDIGALAGKPVMEGKAVLFKRFADVDVFDIEVNSHDPEEIIKLCQLLEPTFGGINLEDIKAPDCFQIEEALRKTMKIPVFHDDQHGTAIISGAALLNALEVVGKDIQKVRVVFNGAGAAGIACAEHYVRLGVKRENIMLCDTKGVVYKGRKEGMNKYKERFAQDTTLRTLAEAMVGADVFAGLSVKDAINQDMVRSMAADPVVFAMANPDPEITYEDAKAARPDVIIATGTLRLSQPGQQRARVPLHLPRRSRCAGHCHQRRDEAGGHARACRSRQRRRSRFRLPRLRCAAPAVRPRISHSQALRSARADVGGVGRGRSRHAQRSGPGTRRSRLPTARNLSDDWARPTKFRAP